MINSAAYRIVGRLPDGTIGIQQFSNSQQRAKLIERFIKRQHPDWQVNVEVFAGPDKRTKRRSPPRSDG